MGTDADDVLRRYSPRPPLPVDAALLRARASLTEALLQLRRVPDSALEANWPWHGRELDVRYGFYRQFEAFSDARAASRSIIGAAVTTEAPARPLVAAATAARWDLHGLLAGLLDDDLDRDPGNGEWTLRQTLAHIVSGQRGYGAFTAWWLTRPKVSPDELPASAPAELNAQLPEEDEEGTGSLANIRARLDAVLDLSIGALGGLDAGELAVPARWSGVAVTVAFRLTRWASHLREHTIQVEKTLGFVGHSTTEVERLMRLIAGAYGELEDGLIGWPAQVEPLARGCNLAEETAAAVAADARSVRASAAAALGL